MTRSRVFFTLAILIAVGATSWIVVYAREVSNTVCPVVDCVASIDRSGNASSDLIVLNSPKSGAIVTSPVNLQGMARGYWFFEGTFPVTIVNWDGLIIGEGYATAEDEWMTEEFVPFKAQVNFTLPDYLNRGAIILKKNNASGLPKHDAALEVPILFW